MIRYLQQSKGCYSKALFHITPLWQRCKICRLALKLSSAAVMNSCCLELVRLVGTVAQERTGHWLEH